MTAIDHAYPLGKFQMPPRGESGSRDDYLAQLTAAPDDVRAAVSRLSDRQLDTPYREGGWTVLQVVHHLADSQVNAYVRFKLALTEAEPVVKPYNEALWAQLPDASGGPIALSLDLFEAVTRRWVAAARVLEADSFERTFRHLELGPMTLNQQLALYAWHGRHHIAQVTTLAVRLGWV